MSNNSVTYHYKRADNEPLPDYLDRVIDESWLVMGWDQEPVKQGDDNPTIGHREI